MKRKSRQRDRECETVPVIEKPKLPTAKIVLGKELGSYHLLTAFDAPHHHHQDEGTHCNGVNQPNVGSGFRGILPS